MSWLIDPLRRTYFRLAALLLLMLPVFAAIRWSEHGFAHNRVPEVAVLRTGIQVPVQHPFYLVWQRGVPPWDYWPLGVALLGVAVVVDLALFVRARLWSRAR